MTNDERQRRRRLLDMLRMEESLLSAKGLRTPKESPEPYFEPFKDSVSCLDFSRERFEPCDECWLMEFVPQEHDDKTIPCHQIEMNPEGETVLMMKDRGDTARMEQLVLSWLRNRIAQLEQDLANEEGSAEPSGA